jgi:hypothetical protein
MGVVREKAGQDFALRPIAKRLREESHNITQEPLPDRWVDLIHRLNELEQRPSAQPQAKTERREH